MNKRGAEMVEYAIVLACIAAVGVAFYSVGFSWIEDGEDGYSIGNLYTLLHMLFYKVMDTLGLTVDSVGG